MTRQELLNKLKAAARCGDPEAAHVAADDALLEYINDPKITDAYNAVHKWYA